MITKNSQKMGGEIMAKRQRKCAIELYYKNPKICKQCNKIIMVKDSDLVKDVRKKSFCNRSCSATWFHSQNPKMKSVNLCVYCKKPVRTINKMCKKCYVEENFLELGKKTKGELFDSKNGYQSARSVITRHARIAYKNSGLKYECSVCKYALHVEICHKNPVSKFYSTSTINEINNINNLVALCPRCHWEFDNGMIVI